VQKVSKLKLLKENEKEKVTLVQEKQEQEKLVNSIKKDKNKIVSDIRKKERESKTIDRQIDRLIREAIAEANRKAALEKARALAIKSGASAKEVAATSSKEPVSSSRIELTPESKLIADNFRANRGNLPWPVEKGFISLGYGDQAHPIYNTLVIHNSGVEITTNEGANARAVFGGVVSRVIVLSPVNKVVVVQHGDYFTVYQNLSSVAVNQGDEVTIKENLGRVRTNGETGKTVIKFLISQNTTYTDPKAWLANK
jgi:septal ring factor EnvC (AmiA/AmiB activator)